jgi:hypothetical protein
MALTAGLKPRPFKAKTWALEAAEELLFFLALIALSLFFAC